MKPRVDGQLLALERAWRASGLDPATVGLVEAHGTATPLNDSLETLAIKKVFGEDAYRIPVSGSKAVMGHALGGTGAIEARFLPRDSGLRRACGPLSGGRDTIGG